MEKKTNVKNNETTFAQMFWANIEHFTVETSHGTIPTIFEGDRCPFCGEFMDGQWECPGCGAT